MGAIAGALNQGVAGLAGQAIAGRGGATGGSPLGGGLTPGSRIAQQMLAERQGGVSPFGQRSPAAEAQGGIGSPFARASGQAARFRQDRDLFRREAEGAGGELSRAFQDKRSRSLFS
jgi:hypothetical protein